MSENVDSLDGVSSAALAKHSLSTLLADATSDNDRLAALLMLGRVVPNCEGEVLQSIYDRFPVDFLHRLAAVASSTGGDGVLTDEAVLALSVLGNLMAMPVDREIQTTKEQCGRLAAVLSEIMNRNDVAAEECKFADGVAADMAMCLRCVLVNDTCFDSVLVDRAKLGVQNLSRTEFELVINMLLSDKHIQSCVSYDEIMVSVVTLMFSKESVTGAIPRNLHSFYTSMLAHPPPSNRCATWQQHLASHLFDLLKSRNVSLASPSPPSLTCECLGILSTLQCETTAEQVALLSRMADVELRLILDDEEGMVSPEISHALVACCSALEQSILSIIDLSESDDANELIDGLVLAVADCMVVVAKAFVGKSKSTPLRNRIALFRLLCAWLNEDMEALSGEYSTLLPEMLLMAKSVDPVEVDLWALFLPSLMQLSDPDSDSLHTLTRSCPDLSADLLRYFRWLWSEWLKRKADIELKNCITTCCQVILNLLLSAKLSSLQSYVSFLSKVLRSVHVPSDCPAQDGVVLVVLAYCAVIGCAIGGSADGEPTECSALRSQAQSVMVTLHDCVDDQRVRLSEDERTEYSEACELFQRILGSEDYIPESTSVFNKPDITAALDWMKQQKLGE